jgi:hypothetical protein
MLMMMMMQRYHTHAEVLWQFSRRLLPEDLDHEFDRTLRVNRAFLDHIAVELVEEMPDEFRGLREEVNTEAQQEADQASGIPGDDDDGHGAELDEGSDGSYHEENEDDAYHSGEEQKIEELKTSPDYPS